MSSSIPSSFGTLTLLLIGGTGAVGREVLRLALADTRIGRVIAPSRRPLAPHARLNNPVLELGTLPEDSPYWRVGAVICTLGTTIKVAGSQAAFAAIDRDLPAYMARCARRAGATRSALNSSLGASLGGNFYLRTKAEAEQAIGGLGYASYTIVRPSLIDADRSEPRSLHVPNHEPTQLRGALKRFVRESAEHRGKVALPSLSSVSRKLRARLLSGIRSRRMAPVSRMSP